MSLPSDTLPPVDPLAIFTPPTRQWFTSTFATPTAAQAQGWAPIAAGDHTLIHAPTGSGKTLAAFLWSIDKLHREPVLEQAARCRVLYVSPLKALAYDIDRNLRAPLRGIRMTGGDRLPDITTAMRTGDTPQAERQRMARRPPDILITTPESLYLLLTSAARRILTGVQTVIIDEVHSIAGSKRGAHLALSLERLEELAVAPQRIGLSATQRPLSEIAGFLGGLVATPATDGPPPLPRPVTVVDVGTAKRLEIAITVPVEDMTDPGRDPDQRSIWPSMYPKLLEQVEEHHSSIVFVNSRGLAERIAGELNDLAGHEVARAHHGSVSRGKRVEIEEGLKAGTLPCVVATSSLELGIDMAAVDLVMLVESPPSVASGLQRVGRAGHQVGSTSRALVYPKHRADLLEAAVVVDRMLSGEIEHTAVPTNPLDVLAQHIVAAVAVEECNADDLFALTRRAYPYRTLTRSLFETVLDMLSGRYPSDEFAELRPRIIWDRIDGRLTPRPGARMLAVTNPGTIPDRGLFPVMLPEGGKVGELDEEMVYETRPGDTIVLGSSAWQIADISLDRVEVRPAQPEAHARLPFWHGDGIGRPPELGRAVGAFLRRVGSMPRQEAEALLRDRYRLDPPAAGNLARFLEDEKEATGTVPSDRTLVVERYRDEIGDWRLAVLSPFGAQVHAPWALAVVHRIRSRHGVRVDHVWSDDGIVFRFPDADEAPDAADVLVDPDEVADLVLEEVGDSTLFAGRFREAAGRALLLPRRRPGKRTPLWMQRRRALNLLEAARKHAAFPIVLEAYREVMQEHFDLAALQQVLADIASRKIRFVDVEVASPSPFATSLAFDFAAAFMYEYDAPSAERRAAALTLDRALLRELLGDPDLRDLLDPESIGDVELELQHLTPSRAAGSVDAMHDMLRDLGPLSTSEAAARAAPPSAATGWLHELEQFRRAFPLRIGGVERWAAVEDAARLRDGTGAVPPPWTPAAFLDPVGDPLGDVVGRYARTHGPFTSAEAASALGMPPGPVDQTLRRLDREGRVTSGGPSRWVDVDVLRRIRRRALARLRREVEPVQQHTFGAFLPSWHGCGTAAAGRLEDVLRHLQGAVIPASILEADVLACRLAYRPHDLEELLAAGEVVWVGHGPIGPRDGRVALYFRDQAAVLHPGQRADAPEGELHDAIRSQLAGRGASFFRDLYAAAGGGDPQTVLDALWDLVWAGEVTNDTFSPVRAFVHSRRRHRGRRPQLPVKTPPSASGRWYLVSDLLTEHKPEATAAATAQQLLDRHGIVTRDAVLAERTPGGFAGIYPVFAAMEESGRVRRGYFVEGLGGAQFALPGAVDRLRAVETSGVVTLAAADPANPYGASLPWPSPLPAPVPRVAGAHVVLVAGCPAAYVDRGGRRIVVFGNGEHLDAVAAETVRLAAGRHRRAAVETINGSNPAEHPLGKLLRDAGFVTGYKGLVFRGGQPRKEGAGRG